MKNQKNKLRLIIAFTMIALGTLNLVASDWMPETISTGEVTQPDGTILVLELITGGENNPLSFLRLNGYIVAIDKSMYYCWARQADDGTIESTGNPVHLYEPERLGLEKDIRLSNEKAEELRDRLQRSNEYFERRRK